MSWLYRLSVAMVACASLPVAAKAQSAFGGGNLAVFRAAASTSNTTGSVLELTTGGSLVQTINIEGTTGPNAMRFSGSATSTGYLSSTADRSLLTFNGAATTNTVPNVNTLNPRGVGTLNQAGTFNMATTYTGTSGQQTRSATSTNNTNWYVADQAGMYTNGGTSAALTGNFRNTRTFGGTVYVSQASSTAGNIQVNTLTGSPSAPTLAGLSGLSNNASMQDFYLVQSGANGSTHDLLYVLSATSNTAGTISKFSLVSGNWVANGSSITTNGGFGLAAQMNGANVDLFYTTGQGALTGNSLFGISDTAGHNATISLSGGSTLFTTAAGTILKGVEFAPVPEPVTVGLLAAGGLGLVRLARRRLVG